MSDLNIHIDLDNDAFSGDDCGPEIARILRALAKQIENVSRSDLEGHAPTPRDINGNKVGSVDFNIDDEEAEPDWDERADVQNFVRNMSDEDLREALEELCGFQCYDHETRETWVDALVENIVDETTSVADIKDRFPRYS